MFAHNGGIVKGGSGGGGEGWWRGGRRWSSEGADSYIRGILRRLSLYLIAVPLTLLAACGGGSDPSPKPSSDAEIEAHEAHAAEVPGDAAHEDVAVISAWADTLREGDVEGAAEFFAVPSVAVNGGLMLRIRTVEDAVAFNESLPCGAELIRAEGAGEIVTATFRLTERPGPGTCGAGTGELAQTAFEIADGEIVEWRRVGEATPQADDQVV
jgi:limonene-1,2-epoxide hydrolase